MTAEWLDSVR